MLERVQTKEDVPGSPNSSVLCSRPHVKNEFHGARQTADCFTARLAAHGTPPFGKCSTLEVLPSKVEGVVTTPQSDQQSAVREVSSGTVQEALTEIHTARFRCRETVERNQNCKPSRVR